MTAEVYAASGFFNRFARYAKQFFVETKNLKF